MRWYFLLSLLRACNAISRCIPSLSASCPPRTSDCIPVMVVQWLRLTNYRLVTSMTFRNIRWHQEIQSKSNNRSLFSSQNFLHTYNLGSKREKNKRILCGGANSRHNHIHSHISQDSEMCPSKNHVIILIRLTCTHSVFPFAVSPVLMTAPNFCLLNFYPWSVTRWNTCTHRVQ